MKTYDGKNITKKEIESVLRSMNQTNIYKLYHRIYGEKPSEGRVWRFIREFAPTNKIRNSAVRLTERNEVRKSKLYGSGYDDFVERMPVSYAMKILRYYLNRKLDGYTKRPFMGFTYLYFCSPVYGHSDYNKSRCIPIKGNERACELLIKLADKYIPVKG